MSADERNDELIGRLKKLADQQAESSPALERRTIAALRAGNLVLSPGVAKRRIFYTACAALLAFAIGLGVGRMSRTAPAPDYTYVLFLQEGASFHRATGDVEEAARVADIRGWAKRLRDQGVPISGMKLEDSTFSVANAGTTSSANYVAGLFTLQVPDASAAENIARGCPHLRYGGDIVIRPIAHAEARR